MLESLQAEAGPHAAYQGFGDGWDASLRRSEDAPVAGGPDPPQPVPGPTGPGWGARGAGRGPEAFKDGMLRTPVRTGGDVTSILESARSDADDGR